MSATKAPVEASYVQRANAAASHVAELEVALADAREARNALIAQGIEQGYSWSQVASATSVSVGQIQRVLAAPRAS